MKKTNTSKTPPGVHRLEFNVSSGRLEMIDVRLLADFLKVSLIERNEVIVQKFLPTLLEMVDEFDCPTSATDCRQMYSARHIKETRAFVAKEFRNLVKSQVRAEGFMEAVEEEAVRLFYDFHHPDLIVRLSKQVFVVVEAESLRLFLHHAKFKNGRPQLKGSLAYLKTMALRSFRVTDPKQLPEWLISNARPDPYKSPYGKIHRP